MFACHLLLVREEVVLEPGDADHAHHAAHDDGPHPEQRELSRGVALVHRAVAGALLPLVSGPSGGQAVLPDHARGEYASINSTQ